MSERNFSAPVIFGEVLFDRFPDGRTVLGGAPFNVAWHLQALGLAPLVVTGVGQDDLGREILQSMSDWGLDRRGVQILPNHSTGTVEVSLTGTEPSYDITDHCAYDHLESERVPALPQGGILYHGTLALRHLASRSTLTHIKQAGGARVFVDVNLRPPWWRRDTVLGLLAGASWVKLNEDELGRLAPANLHGAQRPAWLVAELGLSALVVTKGAAGALAFAGDEVIEAGPPACGVPVVDTVGAGDSFSSVVLLGLAKGWAWPLILERSQQLAAAIVGLRGATTTDRSFYEKFTRLWE